MHMPIDGVQLISASRQTELHICGIGLVGAHKTVKGSELQHRALDELLSSGTQFLLLEMSKRLLLEKL